VGKTNSDKSVTVTAGSNGNKLLSNPFQHAVSAHVRGDGLGFSQIFVQILGGLKGRKYLGNRMSEKRSHYLEELAPINATDSGFLL